MAIQVSDLLDSNIFKPTKVIGFENKYSRIINDAIINSSFAIPSWLKLGDLLIIIGTGITVNDKLCSEFIKEAQAVQCPVVILINISFMENSIEMLETYTQANKGIFIIVDTGLEHQQIYRVINKFIQIDQNNPNNNDVLIKSVVKAFIFNEQSDEPWDWLYLLKLLKIDIDKNYCVGIIQTKETPKANIDYLFKEIRNLLYYKYQDKLVTIWKDLIIVVIIDDKDNREFSAYNKMCYTHDKILEKTNIELIISLGNSHEKLENANISLCEAFRIDDHISLLNKEEKVYTYDMLGFYTVLYGLSDKKIFEDFYHNILDTLWKHDAKYDTNLVETLECYINTNCSIEETAANMIVHKNTIRYRINSIEDILNCSLKNINAITDIVNAFKIMRLINVLSD